MTGPVVVDASVGRVLAGVAEVLQAIPELAGWHFDQHARNKLTTDRSLLLSGWDRDGRDSTGDTHIGVQVRLRGGPADAPRTVIDLEQDVICPALVRLGGSRFSNGVPVTLAWCEGASGMGVDSLGRFEWAATYMIRTDRAELA